MCVGVYPCFGFIARFPVCLQHAEVGKYRPQLILKGNVHSLIFHTWLRNNDQTRDKQTAGTGRSTRCPNHSEIGVEALPELHGERTVADCGSAKKRSRKKTQNNQLRQNGLSNVEQKKKVKVSLNLSLVEHHRSFLPSLITTHVNMRTENYTGMISCQTPAQTAIEL